MRRCRIIDRSSFALFSVVLACLTHAVCGVDVNYTVVPFEPMDGLPSTSASGRPFVLIHQAKCAGSAMRAVIFKQFSTNHFIDSGVTVNDTCIPCSWFGKVRSSHFMLDVTVTAGIFLLALPGPTVSNYRCPMQ